MLSIPGLENVPALKYVIAFAIILVLLVLLGLVLRGLKGSKLSLSGDRGRARQPRLGIVDVYDLDRHRQLILLRRDNVEHLLLVGGPNDVVVETNIVRAPGARLAATAADGAEPAAERSEAPPVRPVLDSPARPELAPPSGGGEVATFPTPAAARAPARLAAARPAPAGDRAPERPRVTPTAAPAPARPAVAAVPSQPTAAPSAPPTGRQTNQSDGDRAVLSGMARDLEDALKRPQEAAARAARTAEAARPPAASAPARPEGAAPARPRPDLGPRLPRTLAGAPRPAPAGAVPAAAPAGPPPQTNGPVSGETTLSPPPGEAGSGATPAVIALPPPPDAPTAEQHPEPRPETPERSPEPPPSDAAPASPPPERPRQPDPAPEPPPRSDPFSIEDIEAEFARLLGRPLDRREKL